MPTSKVVVDRDGDRNRQVDGNDNCAVTEAKEEAARDGEISQGDHVPSCVVDGGWSRGERVKKRVRVCKCAMVEQKISNQPRKY